jgi:hypothetical protein
LLRREQVLLYSARVVSHLQQWLVAEKERHGTAAGEYFSFDKSKIKIVMNYDLFLPVYVFKKY